MTRNSLAARSSDRAARALSDRLFGFFVQTLLLLGRCMPFWLALFLANALITGLLGWYFVPWASRALDWWLNPKPATTARVIWAGVGLIVALYGLCLLVFSQFPP
jgi:uncharacterized protein